MRQGVPSRIQGHCKWRDRPPNHGTGCVGLVKPASFNSGLWTRLPKRTITSCALIAIAPGVAMNFQNSFDGPVRPSPFSRSANLRYKRSASTLRVRSKSAAIEMKEGDLFAELVFHVIPAGVGLDDLASRLRLRTVVRQLTLPESLPRVGLNPTFVSPGAK